jgi:hypothetical protein
MIAMQHPCLTPEEIQDVLAGNFSAAEFQSTIAHLDDCPSCRSIAESIDLAIAEESDGWLLRSIAGQSPDPLQAETACQVALWRMMDTPVDGLRTPQTACRDEPLPANTLGPYRLISPLGWGGMGTVYLAEHQRLKRKCAIKLLPRERVNEAGWLDRFDREMTAIASLEHNHIVRATDAGHEDGWHYLVMEYLEGFDIGRVATRIG